MFCNILKRENCMFVLQDDIYSVYFDNFIPHACRTSSKYQAIYFQITGLHRCTNNVSCTQMKLILTVEDW